MSEPLVWLLACLALYAAYCVYCGVACGRAAASPRSFFLADCDLPAWVFVLAGTGASVSGWIVLGHPDIVARDGLPFAGTALGAITIPLAGVLFLKRQWMLGKRYGYVTPAEMLGDYYGGETIRILVLLIALVFAVPFAGMQIAASGSLIATLSGGAIAPLPAMWVLSAILFAYVCIGGLRAAAVVGSLQALLMGAGLATLAVFAFWQVGGFAGFNDGLAKLGAAGPDHPALLQIPGVMQFSAGLGLEAPAGSAWTTTMILSYGLALMGLQLAPGFSMLAFASRSPKGFEAQQTWATAGLMGAILVVSTAGLGLGALLLPGAPASGGIVAALIGRLGASDPWLLGLLGVCGLASVQGLVALHVSTTATMLVRDLYRRYFDPALDVPGQRRLAQIAAGLLVLAALILATFAPGALAMLGGLALGFGFQLLPVLAGLCWLTWITREAATVGLAAGLIGVLFTEPLGLAIADFFGLHLPWGRWPWTIHSAGWGMACNLAVCLVLSLISQKQAESTRRRSFHDFLLAHAALPSATHMLRPLAWAATLLWLFFALGPGALYGNALFGDPKGGLAGWALGMPSLWVWQILWWALGVLLIWFLGNRLALSTVPPRRIAALPRSQRPASDAAALPAGGARTSILILAAAAGLAVFANWIFG